MLQSTLISGRWLRPLRAWIALARSSLPVPVSPRSKTVESVGATISTLRRVAASAGHAQASITVEDVESAMGGADVAEIDGDVFDHELRRAAAEEPLVTRKAA